MPDPYTILGISRSATPGEIRAAFRRQARRFHPDVSDAPDAAARFAAVASAYEQLTAPPGSGRARHAPASTRPPTTNAATEVDREEAAEVYDAFFRQGSARSRAGTRSPAGPPPPFRPVPGSRDVLLELPLTPAEAAEGAALTIPTPAGPRAFAVPAGTPDGREFRLTGLGPPTRSREGPSHAASRADLLVRVRIVPASGAGL